MFVFVYENKRVCETANQLNKREYANAKVRKPLFLLHVVFSFFFFFFLFSPSQKGIIKKVIWERSVNEEKEEEEES